MAVCRWQGKQKKTAQVNTITPANVGAGNTFSVIINSKTLTYTATGTTVAEVTAGLVALLTVSTEPEFAEITWADISTAVTATARTPGKPFTQTSSATGGTASLTTATATANTSPNDVNDGDNWSTGATPANGDDVYIDGTSVDLLWSLTALAAITPNTITIAQSFSNAASGGGNGTIGLPEIDVDSNAYHQYRPQFLQFAGCTSTCTIGNGNGSGSGRIKLDFQSTTVPVVIYNTGAPIDQQLPAVIIKGTSAGNTLDVQSGSFGSAVFGGETANWSGGIKIGAGGAGAAPVVTFGAGVTWATTVQTGGTVTFASGGTTLTQYGGTATLTASTGSLTTMTVSGSVSYQGAGTITTLNVQSGGSIDFTADPRSRTVTNCNAYGGQCTVNDPGKTVTWTNGIAAAAGVDLGKDCRLILGNGRTFAISG